MKIGICDDMMQARKELAELIVSGFSNCTIFDYSSGEELLAGFASGLALDLLFLDVYMDGVNGIETAKKIRETNKTLPIIFLTTSPDFALSAFGVHATGYLLKPVNPKELFGHLDKWAEPIVPDSWIVKTQEGTATVCIDQLLYCEQRGKFCEIYMTDGTVLHLRTTFANIEQQLSVYPKIAPCGRSYLLNLTFVRTLNRQEIVLTNGKKVAVPRNAYGPLRQAYLKLYTKEV